MSEQALKRQLSEVLAPDDQIFDSGRCAEYSEDICGGDHIAAGIARPRDIAALRHVVQAATGLGYAIIPRGSGHSYTGGVVPDRPDCLIVDITGLDRIADIDTVNRRVQVEAGCNWAALFEKLGAHGLRTPFFGPLSGYRATIGGTLSQGAAFFGSAMHGYSARSVAGLSVVLADGTLLRTGTGADGQPHPHPGGPDPGSLFLGDCGAFGIKAEVVLNLRNAPASETFASFEFADMESMLSAQTGLIGIDGVADCFGFDPQTHVNLARGGFEIIQGARILADVARGPGTIGSRLGGIRSLLGNGLQQVAALRYSLHLCIEGESESHAMQRLANAAECALEAGGRPIPDTIPRVTRSRPFRPIKALLGPDGERWLTVHGIFRPSDSHTAWRHLQGVMEQWAQPRSDHQVTVSFLTVTSADSVLIEPHLFWPDALGSFHRQHVTPSQLRRYRNQPARHSARACAHDLRAAFAHALQAAGAGHLQIGRYYPWWERLDPGLRAVLQSFKATIDPDGRMNPGVLLPSDPDQGG